MSRDHVIAALIGIAIGFGVPYLITAYLGYYGVPYLITAYLGY